MVYPRRQITGRGAGEIGRHYQLSAEICARIARNKDVYFSAISRDGADIYPAVGETIRVPWVSGFKLAVVTGAKRGRLERSAGTILQSFNVVVCADDTDVSRHKPYPDPWLAAIRRLGVSVNESIGVENAVLGIQLLHAAGIFAVALTTTLPACTLSGTDKIISSISDILMALPIDHVTNLP